LFGFGEVRNILEVEVVEERVNDEQSSSSKIKVVDRRWFTEDGDPRGDRPAPVAKETSPPEAADPPRKPPEPSPPQPPPAEEADAAGETSAVFMELVATLAQQAEMLLAGGQGLPRQPEQARRLIDYLAVLESKTKGNISLEEKQVLSNVVHQLQSMYVQYGR